jgi:hypothetical protein
MHRFEQLYSGACRQRDRQRLFGPGRLSANDSAVLERLDNRSTRLGSHWGFNRPSPILYQRFDDISVPHVGIPGISLFTASDDCVPDRFCQVPGLYTIWTSLDYVGINFALASISFTMSYYGYQLYDSWDWHQEFALIAIVAVFASFVVSGYLLLTNHDP